MGQQRLPLPVGQARERLGDGGLLLAREQVIAGSLGRPEVDHAVLIPVPGLLGPHRGDEIARRDDRVRLQHARLDPTGSSEDPGQGLLYEVVCRRRITNPGRDDAPHHRDERSDVPRRVVPCSGVLNGLSAHT